LRHRRVRTASRAHCARKAVTFASLDPNAALAQAERAQVRVAAIIAAEVRMTTERPGDAG